MWVGWHRRNARSPWRRVCEGASLDEAHKALLAAVKGRRVHNLNLFLTGGKVPPSKGTK